MKKSITINKIDDLFGFETEVGTRSNGKWTRYKVIGSRDWIKKNDLGEIVNHRKYLYGKCIDGGTNRYRNVIDPVIFEDVLNGGVFYSENDFSLELLRNFRQHKIGVESSN